MNTTAEYLLQTDQGSLAFLVEVLVTETYAWLDWLALALLDDADMAQAAAIEALAQALAHTYQYRSSRGVQPWLAGFLLQAAVRLRPPGAPEFSPPERLLGDEPAEAALLAALQAMDLPTRAAVLLRYLFGWAPQEIAQMGGGLAARLGEAERRLAEAAQGARLARDADPPATRLLNGPDLDLVVGGWLKRRWPAPAITETDLAQVIRQVEAQAVRQAARRRRLTLVKEMLLVGVTVLGLAVVFWGINVFDPPEPPPTSGERRASALPAATQGPPPTPPWVENVAYVVQTGDTLEEVAARSGSSLYELRRINGLTETQVIYPGLPMWVPVPEFAPGGPTLAPFSAGAAGPEGPHARLSRRSSPQEVSRRMGESGAYWKNLWADLQLASYSLFYDRGESNAYRMQVWLWPPGRSLELYNDLSTMPTFRHIVLNGRNYTSAGPSNAYLAPDWSHPPDVLLQSPLLREMFFPGALPAARLQVGGEAQVAGQTCVIVEYAPQPGYSGPTGDPERFLRRLWVDVDSGVVLRRQLINPTTRRLLSDVMVTEIAYDVDIPVTLFDPRRRWEGSFAVDWTGKTTPLDATAPTPTRALPLTP